MSFEQRARSSEDLENFFLASVHSATLREAREKTKSILLVEADTSKLVPS